MKILREGGEEKKTKKRSSSSLITGGLEAFNKPGSRCRSVTFGSEKHELFPRQPFCQSSAGSCFTADALK